MSGTSAVAPFRSALFHGQVTHVRSRPKRHALAYPIVSLLVDLDELDALDRGLRLFSVGRFNLLSFAPRDRGDGSATPLKAQVEAAMRAAGVEPDGGPVHLLTMPRVLGFAFNPLSVFFCHGRDGALRAILWEVDNTFGQRHGYMIPVTATEADGSVRQSCHKAFYVSPFMDMDLRYAFRVTPPGDALAIAIDVSDRDGVVLRARHLARRVEISDGAAARAFLAFPFLALRVVAGIHWEALKIWLKGVRPRARPAPPSAPVTFVPAAHPLDQEHGS